jgi:ribonuclease HI
MDVSLFMSYFSLWQMSSESEVFFGFANNSSQHTRRLASASWVIFTPQGHFLSSGGICLGDATNNIVEYNVVIEILRDVVLHEISHLWVYLDDQLVVS